MGWLEGRGRCAIVHMCNGALVVVLPCCWPHGLCTPSTSKHPLHASPNRRCFTYAPAWRTAIHAHDASALSPCCRTLHTAPIGPHGEGGTRRVHPTRHPLGAPVTLPLQPPHLRSLALLGYNHGCGQAL